ncbi:hypothetical protein [Colwellia sp. E2M01]|uniref:hypothetical protein n=1 Tax=Colwellia sp. E2M01 TaxID=2841561 RepID=UPI001C0A06E7|nr:hypothetical protein [Colwellia sp. E2M01]MBU2870781.1 hypothetical protein [Colwellia sp. E2M01]
MNNRFRYTFKKLFQPRLLWLTALVLLSQIAFSAKISAEEVTPVIIQSQVKGSQEQPNVIYIMPWQGVEQIIEVKGKERTIKLPQFSPIHPKAFKLQVQAFADKQAALKSEALK